MRVRPSHNVPHVVIVGGDVTGLAAAYYLQKKSQETGTPVRCTLLESTTVLGGKIISQVTMGGNDHSAAIILV